MNKLFLMSQASLSAYIDHLAEAEKHASGMTAADIEANTKLVVQGSLINEVNDDGSADLTVDAQGVAHIPIIGMLKNGIGIKDIIGAVIFGRAVTTYNFITQATAQADAIPEVKKIRYEINTGGGEVAGIEPASNAIFNAKKPTEGIVYSASESGGYWLGSQTDNLIAAGKTSFFGSIGVAAEFIDETAAETAQGLQKVILTSTNAPKKRFDIKSEEGQAIIIGVMDEMHDVFVEHIVRGRSKKVAGLSADFVNANFGQGGSMGAKKALKNKMIDSIISSASSANDGGRMSVSTGTQPPHTPGADSELQTNNTGTQMNEAQFLAFLESNADAKAFYIGGMAYIAAVAAQAPDLSALNLTEVLALSPVAATEQETALTAARTEVESGKLTAEQVGHVFAICTAPEYAFLASIGPKVISGQKSYDSFEDLVVMADQQTAMNKSKALIDGQPEGTPAGDADLGDDTGIKSPKIQSSVKDLKARLNLNQKP